MGVRENIEIFYRALRDFTILSKLLDTRIISGPSTKYIVFVFVNKYYSKFVTEQDVQFEKLTINNIL